MPAELAAAPFSGSAVRSLVGRKALAGPAYQRLTRGAYWIAGEEVTHGRRIQAMLAVLPEEAALRGLSAAWRWGLRWATADDPVEVALPHRRRVRSREGLLVTGESLDPDELSRHNGVRLTTVARTAFDLARRLPLEQAVAAVDALLRAGEVQPDAVLEIAERHGRASGRRQVVEALRLCDPRAESPRESLLRLAVARAGLPAPVPQFEVRAGDRFMARLDLAWPEARVALEYDGAHHRERDQYGRDVARHNALRAAGWLVFQVDAVQWTRLDAILAEVAKALTERLPR